MPCYRSIPEISWFRAMVLALVGLSLAGPAAKAGTDNLNAALDHIQSLIAAGDFSDALDEAQKTVTDAESAGDTHAQATAELRVSDALYYLGRHEETLPPLERALVLYGSTDDNEGIGRTYYSMAYYYERSEPSRMIELLEQGRTYALKADDPSLTMNIANAMGVALWNMGRYDEAIPAFEQSIAIARQTGNGPALASASQNLGLISLHRGDNLAALEFFRAALVELQKAGNNHGVAVVLGNMANAYHSLGRFEEAMDNYRRSLAIHRADGYQRGIAIQLGNLASVIAMLDGPQAALDYQREAEELARKIGDLRTLTNAQLALGNTLASLERYDEADGFFDLAVASARQLGDPYTLISPLKAEAQAEFMKGATTKGWDYLHQAEAASGQVGDTYTAGLLAGLKADQLAAEHRPAEAVLAYRQAVTLHAQTSTRTMTFLWLDKIAGLERRLGDRDGASVAYESSLDAIDGLDALLCTGEFRLNLFSRAQRIYQEYALWLADKGMTKEAWTVLERGRGRDLNFRLMQDRQDSGLSPDEQAALGKLSSFQRRLREEPLSADERTELLGMIAEAEKQYDRTRWGPSRRSSPARSLSRGPHVPAGTLAVLYSVYEDTLMVLSADEKGVEFRRVADAAALMNRCGLYMQLVSDPTSGSGHQPAGRALFDLLLGPELAANTPARLVISPDKELWGVPFAALRTPDNRFLGAILPLSVVPSLATLNDVESLPPPSGQGILTVACTRLNDTRSGTTPLPDLPFAAVESGWFANLAGKVTQWLNPGEDAFKAFDFRDIQLLHIASHTLVDADHPNRATIVLAPGPGEDGYLQAREIYRLPLDVRLTVVTGCRSGAGGIAPGEGLLGLTHALLSAGSRSVVLSRWDVTDEGAAFFTAAFLKALPSGDIEQAVQIARAACIGSAHWSHPAWWAPYFVAGSGTQTCKLAPRTTRLSIAPTLAWVMILLGLGGGFASWKNFRHPV